MDDLINRTDDLISRQALIEHLRRTIEATSTADGDYNEGFNDGMDFAACFASTLPSAQPERLTDDDLETIRIHLSAAKEKLCNQRRWKEAEEYERIINRLKTLEFVQPEQRWIPLTERLPLPEDGQVVVQYNDGDYDILKFPTAYRRCDIVAWMPLPEPYKGDKQDG